MSLYDDLGVATSDTKTEGWSKNFKLLQSQLKVKKAALTQAKVGPCLCHMPDNNTVCLLLILITGEFRCQCSLYHVKSENIREF